MKYRVDNVPLVIRPFWLLYSWSTGTLVWLMVVILRLTCRIKIESEVDIKINQTSIFCLWHKYWFLWIIPFAFSHRRHIWMQHPAAYMKPVHVGLRIMGVRTLLGSGGDEGRRIARKLSSLLRKGWATVISPDGPHGPAKKLKKGVLVIACNSGAPIYPVRFVASRTLELPYWDRKLLPLPFSEIRVIIGKPLQVTKTNMKKAAHLLVERMSSPEPELLAGQRGHKSSLRIPTVYL